MQFDELVARNLAAALLAVEWEEASIDRALVEFLGRAKRRRGKLARRLLKAFAFAPAPLRLAEFLLETRLFSRPKSIELKVTLSAPIFSPAPRFVSLAAPKITTPRELSDWLGLAPTQLDWFADARRMQAKTGDGALRHYRYRFIPKRDGPPRLIESPKQRLKEIQRQILHEILDRVPAHDAAYGFIAGRSCVRAAARHAGERFIVAFDLRDFFLMAPMNRVYALFRSLGYPHAVADRLTRLCAAIAPPDVFETLARERRHDFETRKRFSQLHLPQGAPTSPALANLVAFRLDVRLFGLARRFGATYTRYADDLSFSGDGDFAARRRSFAAAVATIVKDEGFALNDAKTRAMGDHMRQQVTGIVVNDHVNLRREDFDRLKATLYNCARRGASSENRMAHPCFRAHLDGRIAWVEQLNPARGAKLRCLFEKIAWS